MLPFGLGARSRGTDHHYQVADASEMLAWAQECASVPELRALYLYTYIGENAGRKKGWRRDLRGNGELSLGHRRETRRGMPSVLVVRQTVRGCLRLPDLSA